MMIKEISVFEYLKDFEDLRTALSDFYIQTKECRVFGAYENDTGAGLLVCEESHTREVLVLCAKNNDRKIKSSLLETWLDTLLPQTKVRWRILNDLQGENTQIAVNHGFTDESVLHIFRCARTDIDVVQSTIDAHKPLYTFMERRGYVTKSFENLTEDELRQIRDNPDGEFETFLQSGDHIRGKTGQMDAKSSFATVLNGKVYAYVIVVAHGENGCIVENISVARSARRGGTFILPFLNMLNALVHSHYNAVSFAIYETNADALPLMRKCFPGLLTTENVQHNYILVVNGG